MPSDSFDLACIHFVLHDIDKDKRKEIINNISSKLKNGKIFIKEPTADHRGMHPDEIWEVMAQAGFKEKRCRKDKPLITSPTFTAEYTQL